MPEIPDFQDLGPHEPLLFYEPKNEHLAIGRPRGNWEQVAEWLSTWNGGIWMATTRGVTWRCGSRSWWLLDPLALPDLIEARQIALDLGVEVGWSIGSVASKLAKWIGKPPAPSRDRERLAGDVTYNYIECTPGQHGDGGHFDVSAYYYNILARLPTLRPIVHSTGRIIWSSWRPGEEDRFRRLLVAVEPCKPVRNALVGVMVGRAPGRVYYCQGQRRTLKGDPGPWATAAWTVVRSAWEVTRRVAVETDAVWAHTDAVIAPGGLYPETWERLGFKVKTEGVGPIEVCSPICYGVGLSDQTVYYQRGSRYQMPHPRPELPPVEFHRQWLDVPKRRPRR